MIPLRANSRGEEVAEADGNRVVAEHGRVIDETGDVPRHGGRLPLQQHQVQPHAQCRRCTRQLDGFRKCRAVHHQAGVGENAVAMRREHTRVDAG